MGKDDEQFWVRLAGHNELIEDTMIDFEGEVYNDLKLVEEYCLEFVPEIKKQMQDMEILRKG